MADVLAFDPDAWAPPFIPPDGFNFVQAPRVRICRTAADVLDAILCWIKPGQTTVYVTDEDLSVALWRLGRPKSLRFVQKGLNALQWKFGLIARSRVRKGRDLVRQITLNFTLAGGRDRKPKSKSAKTIGPKNFGPPVAPTGASPSPNGAVSLDASREQEKSNRAGAADAGDGTPSSSPAGAGGDAWGGAPSTPKEAAAFLRAKIAEFAESKAVEPPPPREPSPRGPRRERPREVEREERPEEPPGDPVSRAEWEARRQALADAPLDQLAALAALGNREARAELNRRHHAEVEAAKLAAATQVGVDLGSGPDRSVACVLDAEGPIVVRDLDPPPKAEAPPRGRDSPEVIPPPPADKPRRGLLGRLFGRG
ncbi:MAG: hypothetical protein BGO49_04535 [Planctomycetales bacterium 71-10]|nr:MAG: hypothetical protein BGO49_04535 [Planctomycetales bacterium 71-10]